MKSKCELGFASLLLFLVVFHNNSMYAIKPPVPEASFHLCFYILIYAGVIPFQTVNLVILFTRIDKSEALFGTDAYLQHVVQNTACPLLSNCEVAYLE